MGEAGPQRGRTFLGVVICWAQSLPPISPVHFLPHKQLAPNNSRPQVRNSLRYTDGVFLLNVLPWLKRAATLALGFCALVASVPAFRAIQISLLDVSLANQYRGRFSRSAKVRRARRLPVAANGLDELITPVYKLKQRPVSKRVILPESLLERTLPTIKQRSVSGTSLDSEIAIDRTSDSRPVVLRSCRVFAPPMSDAFDNC